MKQILNKLKNLNETLFASIIALVAIIVFVSYGYKNDNSFGFKCSDLQTPEKFKSSLDKWVDSYTKKYPNAKIQEIMDVREKIIVESKCERPKLILEDPDPNTFGFKCSDFETKEKYVDSLSKWISDYLKKHPTATVENMMTIRDRLIEKNKCERPNFTLSDSAINLEKPVLPKQVSWEGKVIAKLTYGRLRLSKLSIDDQYSQFIAEPTDIIGDGHWPNSSTTKNIKVGDIVNVTGKWESTDRAILPWVTIEKIEPSKNKNYTFKNLGFFFEIPENYYSLTSTEDIETIYITPIEFNSDNEEGIVIAARKSSLDISALDWLKSGYSSYELSNGYKTTKIGGEQAYLLRWRDPSIIDGVLLNNPDKTRQITISILGDNSSQALRKEFNKIINTFSFK